MKPAVFLFLLLTVAALGATDTSPVEPSEEEFNLFLFGLVVIGVCVVLFLFAASMVVGVVSAVVTTALVALGIVASSALVGVLHRRFSSGLRALHYQLCAVAALPAGIAILWFGSYLFRLHLDHRDILITGSIAGAFGGLLLAFTFDRLVGVAYRRFVVPRISNATGTA